MAGYVPLYIKGMETGLVQERQNFILPNDAYPVLENAYVWRERIKRKQGFETLGRLRRVLVTESLAAYSTINGTNTLSIFVDLGISVSEPDASIELGSLTNISIVFPAPISQTLSNTNGSNVLTVTGAGPITSATINYATGVVTITANAVVGPATPTFSGAYYPSLPVMGLRTRELNSISNEMLIAFDQKYAYRFATSGWREFIPGTTWTGDDNDFFWSTNYWVSAANLKLFWVTNFSGTAGDPIRYTDGVTWTDFAPTINASGDVLAQCLCILPFRSRLVAFNTLEGPNLANSTAFFQRIRWSQIGSPLPVDAWRDDIRGKGGFLDIPTSESIVSVGFVRDNLVIYCENSTWQLRYTGRSIAPFQIEKVNTELGAESTFSTVQFDTSLVGIGDKGVVECDSYKSQLIDIKIPDLVFSFNNLNDGVKRVHGIRDFINRLAYWTYPVNPASGQQITFPNRRLVYNYENDSWAIFTDSLTTLGTFQPPTGRTWLNTKIPWTQCNFPWVNRRALVPDIVGGNQQGYVLYLDSKVSNDASLFIKNIVGNDDLPTVIESPNHNLEPSTVISIAGILTGSDFANLNGQKFGVFPGDNAGSDLENKFRLFLYNPEDQDFTLPQKNPSTGVYLGGGEILIRDGFYIESKKFNFADEGQSIQIGYIDILMDSTDEGEITLNMFLNYNDSSPVNTLPQNVIEETESPDEFFNSVIPTTNAQQTDLENIEGSKYLQRVFCPVRGNFITIVYTLSNAQLIDVAQESDVQIDSQVVWMRKAGRLTNI